MALIPWRDSFEIGIASVDHEHRELIGLINQLHETLDSGEAADEGEVGDFLAEIFVQISAHFALEETEMRAMRYDDYESHKADHENLLDDIRDMMDVYEAGQYTAVESQLAEHLDAWFSRHFQAQDARLHTFLHARGA